MIYKKILKRPLDITVSLIALIFLSPLFGLISLVLYFENNGEPFFSQRRPGKNGKIFKVVKFKTMNDRRDSNGQLLPDEHRLSKVGSFLRKTSLDEIPQLLNVLKGNMSLVGPRPLLVEYLPLYNEFQNKRHTLKPGITGWAQVNGRNAISWKEKFEFDVWYIENISFSLDFKIMMMTIQKVFKREGISQRGQATTTKFKGNK